MKSSSSIQYPVWNHSSPFLEQLFCAVAVGVCLSLPSIAVGQETGANTLSAEPPHPISIDDNVPAISRGKVEIDDYASTEARRDSATGPNPNNNANIDDTAADAASGVKKLLGTDLTSRENLPGTIKYIGLIAIISLAS